MFPPELLPVSICLLVVSDEDPKQDDHGYLPHKADRRQGDPHVGALGASIEPAQHGGGWVVQKVTWLRPAHWLNRIQQEGSVPSTTPGRARPHPAEQDHLVSCLLIHIADN